MSALIMKHRPRTVWLAATALAAIAIQTLAFPAETLPNNLQENAAGPSSDLWYVIKIAGQPAGYIRETTIAEKQVLKTNSQMVVVLNRLGSRVEIGFFSFSEESPEGVLRRVRYEMTASSEATRSEALVGDGKVEIRNESGGKTYSGTLSYTGKLLGSEGIRRLTAAGLKKPGDKVVFQTFLAEASLIGKMTRTFISRETIRLGAREISALKVEEVLEGLPIKRTGWMDEQGNLLRQQEPGPFGLMEVYQSERAEALAAAYGAELPQEVYQNSIVRTNIRLPRAFPIDSLKVRMIHRQPELGWPDLDSSGQKVLSRSDKEVILEIRRPKPLSGAAFPVARTEDNHLYLEPNALIQSDDAEILRLAKELVGAEQDAFEAAISLERWVAENMEFDLGIVFAPATEIIRNRRGTCVGYATLLASLARAAGLPSRIVMGYVYALGMFGGHAWTEVMIGEKWVPLDAAVVNAGAADAARIAVVSSSLADGLGEITLGAAQQVFGHVGIEIIAFETGGKIYSVPLEAEPFLVKGNAYENPWLGIHWEGPVGFKIVKTDALWPDRTVVGLDGPAGEKCALEQHEFYPWEEPEQAVWTKLKSMVPEGKKDRLKTREAEALVTDSADGRGSAAAFIRGLEVWIIRTEGKDAPGLLRQLAKSIRISSLSE